METNIKLFILTISLVMLLYVGIAEAKPYQMTISVVSKDYPILIKPYEDLIECRRERREYLHLLSIANADKPIIVCTPMEML